MICEGPVTGIAKRDQKHTIHRIRYAFGWKLTRRLRRPKNVEVTFEIHMHTPSNYQCTTHTLLFFTLLPSIFTSLHRIIIFFTTVYIAMSTNTTTSSAIQQPTTASPANGVMIPSRTEENLRRKSGDPVRYMKSLYLAAMGLSSSIDPTRPLFDLEASPWAETWKADLTGNNLTKDLCIDELERRWKHKLIGESRKHPPVAIPLPKQWRKPHILADLHNFPIDTPADLLHILSTYAYEKERSELVLQAKQGSTAPAAPNKKKWTGRLPCLRLIHCLIDFEDIKKVYSNRLNMPSTNKRLAMDNRKSDGKHPKTVWEIISDKWNDPTYTTTTEIVLGAKKNAYDNPIVVTHSMVERFVDATAAKCEKKFQEILLGVVRADNGWKKSGTGYGGVVHVKPSIRPRQLLPGETEADDMATNEEEGDGSSTSSSSDDEEVEVLEQLSTNDLSNKGAFVKEKDSHVLYAWYQLEKHDLLRASLQKLDTSVSVGAIGVTGLPPDISGTSMSKSPSVSGSYSTAEDVVATSIDNLTKTLIVVAEMEASDNEKGRAEAAERHGRNVAFQHLGHEATTKQHQQQAQIAIMSAIDKLNVEKRVKESEVLALQEEDDENPPKRSRTARIHMLESHIHDIMFQMQAKEKMVKDILEQEQAPDLCTPQRSNKTPESGRRAAAVAHPRSLPELDDSETEY